MLQDPTFLSRMSNGILSLFLFSKRPDQCSVLLQFCLLPSWCPHDGEINDHKLIFGIWGVFYLLYYSFSLLSEIMFYHWLFITYRYNMQGRCVSLHYVYNIMRLNILFVLISKNVWKAIPHSLIAPIVLHSFTVQQNYLRQLSRQSFWDISQVFSLSLFIIFLNNTLKTI